MSTKVLTITKLYLPPNITTPITASLYYKQFYASSYTLIQANVTIALDGTVIDSPAPQITIDPSQKYVIRAVNDLCNYEYIQDVIIASYCPTGYSLSADGSYCFKQNITSATPPTNPQNSIAVTHNDYSVWGSLIFNSGYNINGTGTFTQIPYSNTFWLNGTSGFPSGTGANTTLGPLNRSGLWTATPLANQTIGFSVCINAPSDGVYYVGMGSDNYATIKVDGVTIVQQDATAIGNYLTLNGYATVGVEATFRFWFIYPITLTQGEHIVEVIGTNVSSVATLGVEIYNNTAAQISAATSYSGTGLNLIFSTKDYIGFPIQSGNMGIGYSCPTGYALAYCQSPIICVQTFTTALLY